MLILPEPETRTRDSCIATLFVLYRQMNATARSLEGMIGFASGGSLLYVNQHFVSRKINDYF